MNKTTAQLENSFFKKKKKRQTRPTAPEFLPHVSVRNWKIQHQNHLGHRQPEFCRQINFIKCHDRCNQVDRPINRCKQLTKGRALWSSAPPPTPPGGWVVKLVRRHVTRDPAGSFSSLIRFNRMWHLMASGRNFILRAPISFHFANGLTRRSTSR